MNCYQFLGILLCLISLFYVVCTLLRSLIEQEETNKNFSKTLLLKSILLYNTSNITNTTHANNQVNHINHHHHHHHILHQTFFTLIKHKYTHLIVDKNNKIPTDHFLNYSSDVFSIFDNFGVSTFSQVKKDVIGNVVKLRTKYSSNVNRFYTLQDIVESEVDDNTTHVENSSTDALLWLIRSFWFLREFLYQFSKETNPNFTECVSKAYESTIMAYHNWIIQGVFSFAMGSLPKSDDFLKDLALDPQEYLSSKEMFDKQIFEDMKQTVNDIDFYINNIKQFYESKNLKLF